jgi:FixJ family two-component response regulator
LILDVELPDISGSDLQTKLAQSGIEMPIVFLPTHGDIAMSVRAMKAGAAEFLTKPRQTRTARRYQRGAPRWRSPQAKVGELRSAKRLGTLTRGAVLALVVTGRLNKQIAGELGITDLTIKVHRGRVMRKMGADSLADLVRMAEKLKSRLNGILPR